MNKIKSVSKWLLAAVMRRFIIHRNYTITVNAIRKILTDKNNISPEPMSYHSGLINGVSFAYKLLTGEKFDITKH